MKNIMLVLYFISIIIVFFGMGVKFGKKINDNNNIDRVIYTSGAILFVILQAIHLLGIA
jgi:hypothetical protein